MTKQATDQTARALAKIRFNEAGLVPAIAQQYDTGEVLMMAWQNADAIAESFQSGRACYWSRSRQELWRKGDTSGHVQYLKDLRIDCDGDTVLMLVDQIGAACHTDRPNCFFTSVGADADAELTTPLSGDAAEQSRSSGTPDWRLK